MGSRIWTNNSLLFTFPAYPHGLKHDRDVHSSEVSEHDPTEIYPETFSYSVRNTGGALDNH